MSVKCYLFPILLKGIRNASALSPYLIYIYCIMNIIQDPLPVNQTSENNEKDVGRLEHHPTPNKVEIIMLMCLTCHLRPARLSLVIFIGHTDTCVDVIPGHVDELFSFHLVPFPYEIRYFTSLNVFALGCGANTLPVYPVSSSTANNFQFN